MAKTTPEIKQITVTRVVNERVINVEMTQNEAEAIYALLQYVGGCPNTTPRGLCSAVADSLKPHVDMEYYTQGKHSVRNTGYDSNPGLVWKTYNEIESMRE